MKAFILCAGRARRLEPLSCAIPKASVPVLNLPLLFYNWFYLERMGLSHAVLNSFLFPEILRRTVRLANASGRKTDISVEERPLGSAGGLFALKSFFEDAGHFLYLNGDSLFFPSDQNILNEFLSQGKTSPLGLLYGAAFHSKQTENLRALWVDREGRLRLVGAGDKVLRAGFQIKHSGDLKQGELRPVQFSGLALFKSEIYNFLSSQDECIFEDTIRPLLSSGAIHVFTDEAGLIFEGGTVAGLLQAAERLLQALFSERPSVLRSWLLEIFRRFDPEDKEAGLQRGMALKAQTGGMLLCPDSVKGANFLKVQNFAVLGPNTRLIGRSVLNSAVLGRNLSWRGPLTRKILIQFFPDKYTDRV